MARSLSQFITEQDAPLSANVPENSLEKVYVESMLAMNAANYYLEAANLVAFADECDIVTSIVQEAGDTPDEGKKNIFKRAGDAVKNAWKWFLKMLGVLWDKIAGAFKKEKVISAADQTQAIFDQFKKLYPEITDNMSDGDYFDFLKKKFPKVVVDVSPKDVHVFKSYITLYNTVTETNEILDGLIKDSEGINKPSFDITEIRSKFQDPEGTKREDRTSLKHRDTEARYADNKIKDSIDDKKSFKMAEIMDYASKVTELERKEPLETICKEGKSKIKTLQSFADKTEAAYKNETEEKESNNAKTAKMTDVYDSTNGNKTIQQNKEAMEYLSKWVNSLTARQADVAKGLDNAKRMADTLAKVGLKKANENNEEFGWRNEQYTESTYLV